MKRVVLVHGWGYDATLWDAVRAQLDPALPVNTVDLGFYGKAQMPKVDAGDTVLAVGHSLGALWWLTHNELPWHKLLCLNGFPRFTECADYQPAVAPRVLARMRSQFERDPAAVLADFHAVCGGHVPAGAPDPTRLAAGLGWLADWDGRAALAARAADIFALAGNDDAIVPRAMSTAAFAGLPETQRGFGAAPGHLLPITEQELCARWIERLLA